MFENLRICVVTTECEQLDDRQVRMIDSLLSHPDIPSIGFVYVDAFGNGMIAQRIIELGACRKVNFYQYHTNEGIRFWECHFMDDYDIFILAMDDSVIGNASIHNMIKRRGKIVHVLGDGRNYCLTPSGSDELINQYAALCALVGICPYVYNKVSINWEGVLNDRYTDCQRVYHNDSCDHIHRTTEDKIKTPGTIDHDDNQKVTTSEQETEPVSVFVGGSCVITELPVYYKVLLNLVMVTNSVILVGDAPGVDTLVQGYLHEQGYQNVIVYFSGGVCRCNIGNWLYKRITESMVVKENDYWTDHMPKDISMCTACTYGLFCWNGKSRATKKNFERLAKLGKKAITCTDNSRIFGTCADPAVCHVAKNHGSFGYTRYHEFTNMTLIEVVGKRFIEGFTGRGMILDYMATHDKFSWVMCR